ncbi:MAG: hypothetical protein IKX60_03895 [Bacteroidales bacterium]|nr:hypothetical protein [Bacteroidales bacterium]
MYPKFIIMAYPDRPLAGTFIYGKVYNHCDLAKGYGKVYGGGWYEKDDTRKTMLLYGASGDYGEPCLELLCRIPRSLKGYAFYYASDPDDRPQPLDLNSVEWI